MGLVLMDALPTCSDDMAHGGRHDKRGVRALKDTKRATWAATEGLPWPTWTVVLQGLLAISRSQD